MSEFAIHIEDLWKRYRVGASKSASIHESLSSIFLRADPNYFWALREIDIEIKKGEAIGIIGKNGAGKSTLLKLLSKITYPTKGRIEINGRVSSLLEVGTGFHPELTGRQNIYLNGTILGMSRAEINGKFDEIVAFSGVEKFIDTPVKHYSSGMKVRLAFSVAAHLEPEILIIDEVLAVGDAEFQRKCLGKMENVAGEGRTVLFVSHNMGAISKLCSKGILLRGGQVACIDDSSNVIKQYLKAEEDSSNQNLKKWTSNQAISQVCLKSIGVFQEDAGGNEFSSARPVRIKINYQILSKAKISIGFQLFTIMDVPVFSTVNWSSSSLNDPYADKELDKGEYHTECLIPQDLLNEETYKVNVVILGKGNMVLYQEEKVISFTIINDGNMRDNFHGKWIGVVRPKLHWKTTLIK